MLVLGDTLDGVHHRATTQVSANLADQAEIAYRVLKPVSDACRGRLYMVRGTEVGVIGRSTELVLN